MDLPWGDEKSFKFITNVGLVTTNGSNGPDIMACEWTHHVSYKPGIIAICVRESKATHENITETKEFGVSLASTEQSILSSVSGGSSGHDIDKIPALKELGFDFYEAKEIKVPMPKDAALNLECKLIKTLNIGSHTIFFGEVVNASKTDKEPVAYHQGKYWVMDKNVQKPSQEEREKINEIVEKHSKP